MVTVAVVVVVIAVVVVVSAVVAIVGVNSSSFVATVILGFKANNQVRQLSSTQGRGENLFWEHVGFKRATRRGW